MMYGSWDIKWRGLSFFIIFDYFLSFDPPNSHKNQDFEKIKKPAGDIIILHLCTTNDDHMMYGSWDIERGIENFFVILCYFLPFYHLTTRKTNVLKTPGDIIILHMSSLSENHMMYDSWDIEHDRHNFVSFWTIFCPFTHPPNNPTNQKWNPPPTPPAKKTSRDITISNKCTINANHIIYGSWDMKCNRQNLLFILRHFLPFYPPNTPKNENFKKMK